MYTIYRKPQWCKQKQHYIYIHIGITVRYHIIYLYYMIWYYMYIIDRYVIAVFNPKSPPSWKIITYGRSRRSRDRHRHRPLRRREEAPRVPTRPRQWRLVSVRYLIFSVSYIYAIFNGYCTLNIQNISEYTHMFLEFATLSLRWCVAGHHHCRRIRMETSCGFVKV